MFKKVYVLLFFNLCTKQGKAISKKEFKDLKHSHSSLYKCIAFQKTPGKCAVISFELLKLLEKGQMQLLAIPGDNSTHQLHMHVIYINNNYAFDTDSCLQIPYQLYLSVIGEKRFYKSFSFENIQNLSRKEFSSMISSDIIDWCKANDVFLWNYCPVVE